jgi:glycosyltransferase involved in cell wall biosynthesis
MVAYTFYDADNRVRRYAEALAKRGDRVDAIAIAREGQPAFEVLHGVRVFRIQRRTIDEKGPISYLVKLLLFFFRSAWILTVRHLRSPYDLIHVHSIPDFEVFATAIPKLMGARVILDLHDIVPEFYASKFKVKSHSILFKLLVLMEKASCAYAGKVIIANHIWEKTIVARSVRAEKCTTVINYPDPSIFWRRPAPIRASDEFVMCYPGSFGWHQGLDLAIEAVYLLRTDAPNLKFLMIGDGSERPRLEAMIAKLGLKDRVTVRGFVPMEEVAQIMSTVDLGVVPKRSDTFGNEAFSTKILEFMAMGVPVLAARTRVDEFYFSDDLLQFFESGRAEDLAAKILYLMRTPSRRDAMVEASNEFIARNNWDVRKQDYLGLVDRLTAGEESS